MIWGSELDLVVAESYIHMLRTNDLKFIQSLRDFVMRSRRISICQAWMFNHQVAMTATLPCLHLHILLEQGISLPRSLSAGYGGPAPGCARAARVYGSLPRGYQALKTLN